MLNYLQNVILSDMLIYGRGNDMTGCGKVLLLISTADLVATLFFIKFGLAGEANPLLLGIIDSYGLAWFVILRTLWIGCLIGFMEFAHSRYEALRRRPYYQSAIILYLAIYAFLVVRNL